MLGVAVSVTKGAGTTWMGPVLPLAVPPGPVQLTPNCMVACKGPTVSVPERGSGPLQFPDASQLVALLLDQVTCTN
jgi:hypothetical protein